MALPNLFSSAYADIFRIASSQAKTAVSPGVDQHALVPDERKLRFGDGLFRIVRHRQNHDANFEVVLLGEFVVALVVRRHAHDGARAVIHQNVVRDPDRHPLAVERIDGIAPGEDAVLFDLADIACFPRLALLGDELIDFRPQTQDSPPRDL